MKLLSLLALFAVAEGAWPGDNDCEGITNANACTAIAGCEFFQSGSDKICYPLIAGSGTKDSPCKAKGYTDGNKGDMRYVDVYGFGCADGYQCDASNDENAGVDGAELEGKCVIDGCVGKKVPGNCNGNNSDDPECITKTERVTICHRTCSAHNPWVRITIDEDAWDGEGCGHLQHDIRDECKNKAPWTEWGVNRRDYLLVRHGTKDGPIPPSSDYWKDWEPACPYVRNGKCCDWNSTTNPCCGDDSISLFPKPSISVTKLVGPPGKCSEAMAGELFDETYYASEVGVDFAYCYVVTNNGKTGDECLFDITVSDPAPVGGTGDADSNGYSDDMFVTSEGEFVCPGQTKYFEGPTSKVPAGGEGPYNVTATGFGQETGQTVQDKDEGTVVVLSPSISVQKLAGPPDSCTKDMEHKLEQDLYVGKAGSDFVYCYKITNGGDECLGSVTFSDPAALGGNGGTPTMVPIPGSKLCPGDDPVYVTGPSNPIPSGEEPADDVTVSGTGEKTGKTVTDTDPAAVKGTNPAISITKYAGPAGVCGKDMTGMEDVTYTTEIGAKYVFCYKVTNIGDECLGDVAVSDPALGGTGGIPAMILVEGSTLCPGKDEYFESPGAAAPAISEGMVDAVATGEGVDSKEVVTAKDPAEVVAVPAPTPNPKITVYKYVGLPGKCSKDMLSGLEDDWYSTTEGGTFVYCYKVVNSGDECLNMVSLSDSVSGGVGGKVMLYSDDSEFCPTDDPVYKEGTPAGAAPGGEPSVDAVVEGTGVGSGTVVTDSDPAGVYVYIVDPEPEPEPEPEPPTPFCEGAMESPGSAHCPDSDGVSVVKVLGAGSSSSDSDIIWGITPTDGSTVKFKVMNPFSSSKRVFVEYQKPYEGYALAGPNVCDEQTLGTCADTGLEVETACLHGNKSPVSLVQIYFVGADDDISGGAEIPECCHAGDSPIPSNIVAQYSVMIRCTCPVASDM